MNLPMASSEAPIIALFQAVHASPVLTVDTTACEAREALTTGRKGSVGAGDRSSCRRTVGESRGGAECSVERSRRSSGTGGTSAEGPRTVDRSVWSVVLSGR